MVEKLRCMYCGNNISWVTAEDVLTGEIVETIGCQNCWSSDDQFMSDYLFGRVSLIK